MAGTPFKGVVTTTDGSAIRNPIAVNGNMRPKWGSASAPRRVSSIEDPSRTLYLTYGRYQFAEADGKKYTPLSEMTPSKRGIY